MIITNIIGGLGNQLFQVAFAYGLSKYTNQLSKLDVSGFEAYTLHHGFDLPRIFGLDLPLATQQDIDKVLGWRSKTLVKKILRQYARGQFASPYVIEPNERYHPEVLNIKHDAYLEGYWQSEKYFSMIADEIHELFKFKPVLNQQNQLLADTITECNSVSIHIRRGDYVTNKVNQSIYYQCGNEYYQQAINAISSKQSNVQFFVFSDDIKWARNLFKDLSNVTFVSHNQGKDSYVDMQLMSRCKHNIIANSSFSWWGAWLNKNPDKIVISPREWFINGRSSTDLIPRNWLRI